MKKLYLTLQLFFLLLFLTSLTRAQAVVVSDTAFIRASVDSAKNAYAYVIRSQSHLYNGSQYIDYQPLEDEHPYYLANDWTSGTIIYDGEKYENVSLLYDISADKNETTNMAAERPTLVKTLSDKLLTWWNSLPAYHAPN